MAHGHGYRHANFLGQFPVLDPRVLARGEMLLFLESKPCSCPSLLDFEVVILKNIIALDP